MGHLLPGDYGRSVNYVERGSATLRRRRDRGLCVCGALWAHLRATRASRRSFWLRETGIFSVPESGFRLVWSWRPGLPEPLAGSSALKFDGSSREEWSRRMSVSQKPGQCGRVTRRDLRRSVPDLNNLFRVCVLRPVIVTCVSTF